MSIVERAKSQLLGPFAEKQKHQANCDKLFYQMELADEAGETRDDYNELAQTLRTDLQLDLGRSGQFTTIHFDQTLDPYIVLADCSPDLQLSDADERIRECSEQARKKCPWPAGTEYDADELLAGFETPEAAQQAMKNIVTFEVTTKGSTDVHGEFGSAAAFENLRRLMAKFEAETDAVASLERFRPVPDGRYSFRFRNHEIRVRTVEKSDRPPIEWQVGYREDSPKGFGWARTVDDEQYGLFNGRLYIDRENMASACGYFSPKIESIPMPEMVAESLLEDTREQKIA